MSRTQSGTVLRQRNVVPLKDKAQEEHALDGDATLVKQLGEELRYVRDSIQDEIAHVRDEVHHFREAVGDSMGKAVRGAGDELRHMTEAVRDAVNDEIRNVRDAVGTELRHVTDTVRGEFQLVQKEIRNYFIGHISEAPAFMRFNEFIHGGYRLQVRHYSECVRSMFHIHNETVNVWSHLVGFAAMLGLFVYVLAHLEFTSTMDQFVFAIYFLGACAMFLLSTLYHLFNCHSHELCDNLLVCDYVGIFSMIFGSFISAMQISFFCFTSTRLMYQILFATLCVAGSVLVLLPRFKGEEFHKYRMLFFVITVGAAAFPLGHGMYLQGLSHTFNWWVLLALYGGGVLVYATKFPESQFPGKFDIWFASHQLWHMFVLAAGLWHAYSLITMYRSSVATGCNV